MSFYLQFSIWLFNSFLKNTCQFIPKTEIITHLPLDVREQSTGTYTKEFWLQPLISKLLLYKREPSKGILCTADASCWFKAYLNGKAENRTIFIVTGFLLNTVFIIVLILSPSFVEKKKIFSLHPVKGLRSVTHAHSHYRTTFPRFLEECHCFWRDTTEG